MTEKVYLLGRVEEAYKYIKMSDIFILPSRTEAFPYVLLESGLASSVILASRVGGIPEIILENETGLLFDLYDKENVVSKIEQLLSDENIRYRLSNNIHRKVVEEFSIEKMLEQTLSVYSK